MRCTIFIISNLKWYYIGERSRLDKRFILVLYAAFLAEVFSLQVWIGATVPSGNFSIREQSQDIIWPQVPAAPGNRSIAIRILNRRISPCFKENLNHLFISICRRSV